MLARVCVDVKPAKRGKGKVRMRQAMMGVGMDPPSGTGRFRTAFAGALGWVLLGFVAHSIPCGSSSCTVCPSRGKPCLLVIGHEVQHWSEFSLPWWWGKYGVDATGADAAGGRSLFTSLSTQTPGTIAHNSSCVARVAARSFRRVVFFGGRRLVHDQSARSCFPLVLGG